MKGHAGVPVGAYQEEYLVKPVEHEDAETGEVTMVSAGIGQDGKEYGDPVPMEPPIGYEPPHDPIDYIKRALHTEEMRRRADAEGYDTIEEAGDFDIGDDPDLPLTLHEALVSEEAARRAKQQKEIDDGAAASVDERGLDNDNPGDGQSGKVGKNKPKQKPKPDDKGSVPEGTESSDDAKE